MLSPFFGRFGLALILLLGAAGSPARAGVDRWTNTGPFGGSVTVVAVDPHTPSTLYAGGSAGGFASNSGGGFKSTDSGASWVPFGTAYPCGGVNALAIDPATPTTLYASGQGTCKSADGGASWTQLTNDPNTFLPGSVQSFAIDPQATATIYAADGHSVIASTDGGQSWSAGTGLPNGPSYVIVAVDPHTPTTVYAGSNEGSASGAGLFKSTDGGASWSAINNGITPAAGALDVIGLAVDPQTPATLYATTTGGLFKSINGGAAWTKLQASITGPIAIDPQASSTLYVGGNPLLGLSGSLAGIEVSTDGGSSFTPVNTGLGLVVTNALAVNAIAINPQNPATLYIGTGAGMFVTTNSGAAWTAANNGISLLEITALATDPNSATTIYAGTGSNGPAGLFKSSDGGDNWTAINNGLTQLGGGVPSITAITVDPTSSATVYVAVAGGTLFKTSDGGTSWAESDSGITIGVSVSIIAVDPLAPGTLYAAGLTLFKSTNGGGSWSVAENGLPNPGGNQGITGLSAIAATPAAPSALALSTDGNGLFVSLDGANSWTAFDTSPPTANSNTRPVSGRNASGDNAACGKIFATLYSLHRFSGAAIHQFWLGCISPDMTPGAGDTPKLTNGYTLAIPQSALAPGAPEAHHADSRASGVQVPAGVTVTPWAEPDGASEAICAPLGPLVGNPLVPTTVYAGSGCGVLVGTNSGAQMVAMNLGMPANLQVTAIDITPNASDLYIGSLGSGVYRYSFVDSPLAAAVLPSSRSVQTGNAATAFATLINGGSTTATGCGLAPSTTLPASFSYQTTVPGTNALTGAPDTPVSIPAGSFQTFLFSFTPNEEIDPIDAQLEFSCAGTPPAAILPGIDTLLLSGSTTPVPDVVALAATPTGDGIIDIPGASGAAAFAVATINLGAGGTITAAPGTGSTNLPISLSICQTDPATAQCLAAAAASVSTSIASNATPTFAIFVGGGGTIPFDPAGNRIAVQFTDASGNIRGSTSVAVRTQ